MDEQALRDGQVWKNNESLIQVNETGDGFVVANFKVVDGNLVYTDCVIYRDAGRLLSLMARMGMRPTDKVITLCRTDG